MGDVMVGLRSMRYKKEVDGIDTVVANDWDERAVHLCESNLSKNDVENGEGGVLPNHVKNKREMGRL